MEQILNYFDTIPSLHRSIILVGGLTFFWILEGALPLVKFNYNNANIKLSKKTDLILSYILISPDMHKTHHHYKLPHTDSNYGNIFSIWDRVFGTYSYLDRDALVYGVDTFPDEKENSSLKSLLKQPFQPYRKPTTDTEGNLL